MRWTPETARSLAPTPEVLASAQRIARSAWRVLGRQQGLIWGELERHRVALNLTLGQTFCDCGRPERPCVHGVALAWVAEEAAAAEPPLWVSSWSERLQRAQRRGATQSEPSSKREAERERRASARERRVSEGVELLAERLEDLARRGLASLTEEPYVYWDALAAKMTDHQAPGLALRLRELGGLPYGGPGWEERLIEALGGLVLLIEGWRRRGDLPPPLLAALRARIGFSLDRGDLRQQAGEVDRWWVLGRRIERQDSLQVQRTWLLGEAAGVGLVLAFAPGNRPLDPSFPPGAGFEGEVVRYPGLEDARVEPKALTPIVGGPTNLERHAQSATDSVAKFAEALARCPWLERQLFWLGPVRVARHEGGFGVVDAGGAWLPLAPQYPDGWTLLAQGGGHPVYLAGEWDGRQLWPLALWVQGRWWRGD